MGPQRLADLLEEIENIERPVQPLARRLMVSSVIFVPFAKTAKFPAPQNPGIAPIPVAAAEPARLRSTATRAQALEIVAPPTGSIAASPKLGSGYKPAPVGASLLAIGGLQPYFFL
ncbi:hypothetical protein C4K18_3637 [Pseudomonas chlororaphis subsp. aurantiaca]|nr:hypothetical protein C4K18_3637 [Pseudomonas chlororaphis subsp. aurantiaca]